MKCRVEKSNIAGDIECPPNKIYTHRAIFIASLAVDKSIIKNVLRSEDTNATIDACENFGVHIDDVGNDITVTSSSAISTAVAMASAKLFKPKMNDFEILSVGVDASIETKVSLTGAYDDACACYYGGFVVTDNYKKKIIHSEKCLNHVSAVIFIPKSRKRGNVRKLKVSSNTFEQAWNLAKKSDYWNAMILNGLATSPILSSEPQIIPKLIESGALGASVSGNGPSIAAIVRNDSVSKIKRVFSSLDGTTTVSEINNKKAEVHEV